MSSAWLAAATTTVVTPPPELLMGGYLARQGVATGTRDDLEANMLWLRHDHSQVLIVTIDALAISDPVREGLLSELSGSLGVDPANILIAASHTHSGPLGWVGEVHPVLPGELDPPLIAALVSTIATAAGNMELQPAHIGFASARARGVATNRHRVNGPADPTVGVVRVQTHTGDDLAVLYDAACHPTVLGPDNLEWSSDWVGTCRASLRTRLGRVPVLFLQGCSGDVSTRLIRQGTPEADLEQTGHGVARAILRALSTQEEVGPVLGLARTVLPTPTRTDLEPASPGDSISQGPLPKSQIDAALAWYAVNQATLPPVLNLPVSVMTIGSNFWLNTPLEPPASFGLSIRQTFHGVRVTGYCDAYYSYLPDTIAFADHNYEAAASFFDMAAATDFEHRCRKFLARVIGFTDPDRASTYDTPGNMAG